MREQAARIVGYAGIDEAKLIPKVELMEQQYGRHRMVAAMTELTLTDAATRRVTLLPNVRKLCWQLLGPPPEQYDIFYRYADGTPTPEHAAKMAELGIRAEPEGKPKKRTRKKAA